MNVITLDDCKSYATEANLDKALTKLGLDNYSDVDGKGHTIPLRFIKARTPAGRWTAIFLVSQLIVHCGGYVGIASQHGFVSV